MMFSQLRGTLKGIVDQTVSPHQNVIRQAREEGIPFTESQNYKLFISKYARRTITLSDDTEWIYYDTGPSDKVPLVCLPGTSGTAEVFFQQSVYLNLRGYRVISVTIPAVNTLKEFISSFNRFLEYLDQTDPIHLLGTSLGGFLCLGFIERYPKKVASAILTNAFCDTSNFATNAPWISSGYMPEFYLRRYITAPLPTERQKSVAVAQAVDFVLTQIETLDHALMSSRVNLNVSVHTVERLSIGHKNITLIDAMDEVNLPQSMRRQLYKLIPTAQRCSMKIGGDFPYLSNFQQYTMLVQVHLRKNGLFLDEHSSFPRGHTLINLDTDADQLLGELHNEQRQQMQMQMEAQMDKPILDPSQIDSEKKRGAQKQRQSMDLDGLDPVQVSKWKKAQSRVRGNAPKGIFDKKTQMDKAKKHLFRDGNEPNTPSDASESDLDFNEHLDDKFSSTHPSMIPQSGMQSDDRDSRTMQENALFKLQKKSIEFRRSIHGIPDDANLPIEIQPMDPIDFDAHPSNDESHQILIRMSANQESSSDDNAVKPTPAQRIIDEASMDSNGDMEIPPMDIPIDPQQNSEQLTAPIDRVLVRQRTNEELLPIIPLHDFASPRTSEAIREFSEVRQLKDNPRFVVPSKPLEHGKMSQIHSNASRIQLKVSQPLDENKEESNTQPFKPSAARRTHREHHPTNSILGIVPTGIIMEEKAEEEQEEPMQEAQSSESEQADGMDPQQPHASRFRSVRGSRRESKPRRMGNRDESPVGLYNRHPTHESLTQPPQLDDPTMDQFSQPTEATQDPSAHNTAHRKPHSHKHKHKHHNGKHGHKHKHKHKHRSDKEPNNVGVSPPDGASRQPETLDFVTTYYSDTDDEKFDSQPNIRTDTMHSEDFRLSEIVDVTPQANGIMPLPLRSPTDEMTVETFDDMFGAANDEYQIRQRPDSLVAPDSNPAYMRNRTASDQPVLTFARAPSAQNTPLYRNGESMDLNQAFGTIVHDEDFDEIFA